MAHDSFTYAVGSHSLLVFRESGACPPKELLQALHKLAPDVPVEELVAATLQLHRATAHRYENRRPHAFPLSQEAVQAVEASSPVCFDSWCKGTSSQGKSELIAI